MNNNELVIQGFVLKSVVFGESDSIITCLTKDGLFTFKARGVLKLTSKNRASCNLYSKSEFTLLESSNGYFTLAKGKLLSMNSKIYSSLDYMTCLGLVSEATLTFLEQPSIQIYNLFETMIKAIDDDFSIFTISAIYLAKISIEAGFGLNVDSCNRCDKKKNIVHLSFFDGGFICKDCLNENESCNSELYLKSIRYVQKVNSDNYFHYQLDKNTAIKLIKDYLIYLQESLGYKNLGFSKLFNESY